MAKYAIGIGLNLVDARAIVLRSDGKIITQLEKPRRKTSANETIEVLLSLFEDVVKDIGSFKGDITGVGVALGGVINQQTGTVFWPQKHNTSYSYIALPLKEYLEKKFGLAVRLENDANACALAEYILNFSKMHNVVYMFSGVGAGFIFNGRIYRGAAGGAGELFLHTKEVHQTYLGDFSFLRQWSIDLGIIGRVKKAIAAGKSTSLIKKISPTGELLLSDVFAMARKDKTCRDIIKEAGFALGVKTAFIINMLNPHAVVIGGGLEEAPQELLDECQAAVKAYSFSEMRKNITIVYSPLGKSAVCLGAAFLAQNKCPLQG